MRRSQQTSADSTALRGLQDGAQRDEPHKNVATPLCSKRVARSAIGALLSVSSLCHFHQSLPASPMRWRIMASVLPVLSRATRRQTMTSRICTGPACKLLSAGSGPACVLAIASSGPGEKGEVEGQQRRLVRARARGRGRGRTNRPRRTSCPPKGADPTGRFQGSTVVAAPHGRVLVPSGRLQRATDHVLPDLWRPRRPLAHTGGQLRPRPGCRAEPWLYARAQSRARPRSPAPGWRRAE